MCRRRHAVFITKLWIYSRPANYQCGNYRTALWMRKNPLGMRSTKPGRNGSAWRLMSINGRLLSEIMYSVFMTAISIPSHLGKDARVGRQRQIPGHLRHWLTGGEQCLLARPACKHQAGSQFKAGPRLKEMSIHSTGVHKDWCLSGPGLFGKQKCVYDYMSWSPVVESLLMYYQYFTWSLDGLPIWLPQSSYEVIRSSFV